MQKISDEQKNELALEAYEFLKKRDIDELRSKIYDIGCIWDGNKQKVNQCHRVILALEHENPNFKKIERTIDSITKGW